MNVLRPVRMSDLDAILELSKHTSIGLTTFPKNIELLEKKIAHSIASFQRQITTPDNEYYLFVLEDTYRKKIIGVSAIAATTGGDEPLYFFRRETITCNSPLQNIIKNIEILSPISYVRGPSEICSLFLHPEERKKGLGTLLSLSRFLFIARESHRFTNSFFAELRGVIENNYSPFWEGIGRHFLDLSLQDALSLLQHGRSFIAQFLPKHPIYVPLLSYSAQKVIGKTHPHTEAAANILISQGFTASDEIDVFDGGPKFRALKENIRAIAESRTLQVSAIENFLHSDNRVLYLLSNESLEFRACLSHCMIDAKTAQVIIPVETAELLQLRVGFTVRIYCIGNR